MRVAIVGAGKSLLTGTHGEEIDAHDKVVRLKRCGAMLALPQHFGHRVDVVGGSIGIVSELVDIGNDKTMIWGFLDSRYVDRATIDQTVDFVDGKGRKILIMSDLCQRLDEEYRSLREPFTPDESMAYIPNLDAEPFQDGTTLGHNHTSQGLKGLAYTIALLKPDEISLYGFDAVRDGKFSFSLTRGVSHKRYPQHNWACEAKLARLMAERSNVELYFRPLMFGDGS